MRTLQRLLGMLLPLRWWVLLAILLGCIMVASNVGLLSMAAYLIAASAIVPLLGFLTLPIMIVRFAGVVRPVSRYAERLLSHNVTFRLLAKIRVWVYQHLEPLAPGHLLAYRSGDMLARLVADVDAEGAEDVDAGDGQGDAGPAKEPREAGEQGDEVVTDDAGEDTRVDPLRVLRGE